MEIIKNLAISFYETIAWFIKNRVVWHSGFVRIVIRDYKLVRQEATIDVTTGQIYWSDVEGHDE